MLWLLLAVLCGERESASGATYQRVVQGGFGYTPNIIAHPATANLIYSRTDVGGAYRWNSSSNSWTPITDNFDYTSTNSSGNGAYGIESIAVDPSNTNVVYIFNGDVYRSTTQGGNWTPLHLNKFSGGNNDFRNVGERLAVDPANSQIIYCGTRSNGLWSTTNQGTSWNSVAGVPAGNGGYGVGFVVFDKSGGTTNGATRNIYTGVLGNGLYLSTDGGNSWNSVSGGPNNANYYPIRAAMASSNQLLVTYACSTNWGGGNNKGYVYRCTSSTSLQSVTPGSIQRDYCGIAVDFNNSNHVVVITFPGGLGTWGTNLFESFDAGNTWSTTQNRINTFFYTHTDMRTSPWGSDYWMSGILFEPGDSSKLWISDGFSVWRSDNFNASPPNFDAKMTNYEECVTFSLLSLPSGVLLTGVEDRGGFRHTNINAYPQTRFNTNLARPMVVSMDYCQTNPAVIYRAGGEPASYSIGVSDVHERSLDGGISWSNINLPGTNQIGWGALAVSATNANQVVWIPVGNSTGWGGGVFWSADGGQTWTNATGGPDFSYWSFWTCAAKQLAADRVNGSKFYIFGKIDYSGNYQALFYRSTDGGKTWTQLQNYGQWLVNASLTVKAAPGIEGQVWICDSTTLRRSSDSGTTFQIVTNFQDCENFAFGAPMPGSTNPMVYAVGRMNSQVGIYKSADLGATWSLMQSSAGMGLQATLSMDADKSAYGIVYIGTGGRGVIRVSIANTTTALSSSSNPLTYGQSVMFTATVQTNGVTVTAATSNIVFQVDGVPVATNAVASGQATYSTASLTAVAHTIIATYQGDNYYVSSTTNLIQNVNKATPAVTPTWTGGASFTFNGLGQGPILSSVTTSPLSAGATNVTYLGVSGTSYGPSANMPTNVGNYQVNVTIGADANNNSVTSTATTFTIGKATPVVSWTNPTNITYGTALSGIQLNATSGGVAGGFLYTPVSGTVLGAGSGQTLSVQFSPSDTTNYNTPSSKTVSINVGQASLGITANNTNMIYNGVAFNGGNGVTYSGFVNSENSSVLGGALYYGGTSQGATNVGSYAIIASGQTSTNYAISYTNGTLNISKASTFVGASSTKNPSGYKDTVTYTATLPSDATGSVVFFSPSGSFSTNAVSGDGASSLAMTNLLRGTNIITIAYLGDGNHLGSTNTLNQIVTNHPPVAVDTTYYRASGDSLTISIPNLLTNVMDSDGDAITLQSVGIGITGATITTSSSSILYQPATGASSNSNDNFTYMANDGFGGSAMGNIWVSVYNRAGPAQLSIQTNGNVSLKLFGVPTQTYVVQTTTNLSAPWTSISTNTADTNGFCFFTDTNADNGQQFYRLIQP